MSLESDPDLPMLLLKLAIVLILVLLNGFFVAAEFALVKIRSSRIDHLVQEGNLRAKFAQKILNNLNGYLSACQLGITLASLGLGWIGEPAISDWLSPYLKEFGFPDAVIHTISFVIAFSIITAFHITLGEQFPKTYAIRKAEEVTLWTAAPMVIIYKLLYPFIYVLNGSSNWMLRKSGIEPDHGHETAHTEEEIRLLMQESHKSGLIDNNEMALMDNIFEFTETNAREIMIPRTEMVCLYANLSYEENKRIAIQEMLTRYPVCDPDKDNIIGFVHIKDLIKSDPEPQDIRSLVRPLTSVPESMPISSLLRLMQRKKTQMALLIDEYGGTSGLVTVEDIIEEIVGEIQDEFDEERPALEKMEDDAYSIDGLLLIDEMNTQFGFDIPTDDYDTIGGWIYSQVEIPPRVNQKIKYNGYEFVIEEVDHMRISRIVVRKLQQEIEEDLPQVG
ncbi:hemolysin family protein [Paenibacillus sp. y28]|uniref:hemolysin family protein n=1 Tax=Paenibacillus sp. y28 TaxID=3129110 RepID=UPI00301B6B18